MQSPLAQPEAPTRERHDPLPVRALAWLAIGFVLTFLPFVLLRDPYAPLPEFGEVPQLVRETGIPAAAVAPRPLLQERPEGEIRFYVVGASMTFGLPYEPAGNASYARLLAHGLRRAWQREDVHVRPDAYPAVDSPQLAEMAERCLGWGASHLVVVVGTNEFVNRVGSGRVLAPDAWPAWLSQQVGATKGVWAEAAAFVRPHLPRFVAGGEVQPDDVSRLIERSAPGRPALGGLPVGRADRRLLLRRLRRALERVIASARAHGVPVLLAIAPHAHPVAPPWLSGLGAAPPGVDALVASQLRQTDASRLLELRALLARHPERADLHHVHALMQRQLGDAEGARRSFALALDLDLAPLHRTSAVLDTIRSVGEQHGVRVLDLNVAFHDANGLVQGEYFLDYSHPTFEGQLRLARWLAGELCGTFLPELPAAARADFERGIEEFATDAITASSRRLARARILANNGDYYRMVGNYREALLFLERAAADLPDPAEWPDDEGLRATRDRVVTALRQCREKLGER